MGSVGSGRRESVFSSHLFWRSAARDGEAPRGSMVAHAPLVVHRWRDALLSVSNDLSPETRALISGHRLDGQVLQGPHLALACWPQNPDPGTSRDHACTVLACMPRALPFWLRREMEEALQRVNHLNLGRAGVWMLRPQNGQIDGKSFGIVSTATAYPDGSRVWASLTPVALDRHGKAKAIDAAETGELIAQSCQQIGLPSPSRVAVLSRPFAGGPAARDYPRLPRKDGSLRRQVHVVLEFESPVVGPVLLGAGRYRGYGWCIAVGSVGQ